MAKKPTGKPQELQRNQTASTGNGETNGATSSRDISLSNDEIAARAYEIYEREGRSEGRAMDHWLQAENELRAERQRGGGRQDLPRSARLQAESSTASSGALGA